jgi:energy-coupling factor transporter ATP-binding protein EcfA2
MTHFETRRSLTQACEDQALPAGDPRYVEFSEVRGTGDLLGEIEAVIRLTSEPRSCHLLTGHRGGGKTTELNRLGQTLGDASRGPRYLVAHFMADEELDAALTDVSYVDVLFALVRVLWDVAQKHGLNVDAGFFLRSAERLWGFLAETEVSLPEAGLEAGFAKLKLAFQRNPTFRAQVRDVFGPRTDDLLTEVNGVVDRVRKAAEAQGFPGGLVLVVDNLDRLVQHPANQPERDTHRALFVDNGPFLARVGCHMVYTFPLSLNYSNWGPALPTLFDTDQPRVLPMVPVFHRNGAAHVEGRLALTELVEKRVHAAKTTRDAVFEADGGLELLVEASGGYVVQLLRLFRSALLKQPTLPLKRSAIEAAISADRDPYAYSLTAEQREMLARFRPGDPDPAQQHPSLLIGHALLQYRDAQGPWWGLNPVIRPLVHPAAGAPP